MVPSTWAKNTPPISRKIFPWTGKRKQRHPGSSLYVLNGVAGDELNPQADGIHPTARGLSKIVAENILKVIEPLLK